MKPDNTKPSELFYNTNRPNPSMNMKPNQPINKLGSCKGCRPVRKETVRLHKAEVEQCGGKPKSVKVTIPDPAPTVKLQRPFPDPGPDLDQPGWNPPWGFITLLAILIITILYYATK